MAEKSRASKRASSPSWLASLVGAVFLMSAGFMLGLVVGVVKEEPDLVMGHLSGQSEEIRWSEQEAELGTPDVSAGGPMIDAHEDLGASRPWEDSAAISEPRDDFVEAAENAAAVAYEAPKARLISSLPAPERAVPSSAGRAHATGFSVQVGAFSESAPAERISDELRDKGYSSYVTSAAGSRDGRWRVRVGPMATRAEALKVAQELKSRERLPTWVLSEGGN
jgi:cell division septation protein DedD